MNGKRLGIGLLLSVWILLPVGCVSRASSSSAPLALKLALAAEPSPVFASIDEAAVAGLVHARSTANVKTRQSIQIATVRKAGAGYVWTRPKVADSSVYSSRPAVLRFSVTPDDVAVVIVHPASGDARVDRANEVLNESEKKLLASHSGRGRPVYLLTPRMDVVRHLSEEQSYRLARLRFQKVDAPKVLYTADRD